MSSINNTTRFYPDESLQLSQEENAPPPSPPTGGKRAADYNDDNRDMATRTRLNDMRSLHNPWGASAMWTSSVSPSESCNANADTKNAEQWLQKFCTHYKCDLLPKTRNEEFDRTITYDQDPQQELPYLWSLFNRLNERGFNVEFLSQKSLRLADNAIHDSRTYSLATLDEETMQDLRKKGAPILTKIREITDMVWSKKEIEDGTLDSSTPFDSTEKPISQNDLEKTIIKKQTELRDTYSEFFRTCQELGFEPADVFKDEGARTQVRVYARTNHLNPISTTNNTNETTEKNNETTDTRTDFERLMSKLYSNTTF